MLALVVSAQLFGALPDLPEIRRSPSITYVDRSGVVIGVRDGKTPAPVDLAKLPAFVPAAFVAIEDRRFYEHSGFDAVGMARALMADVARGRAAQGASTITQQLARNLFLTQDQTMERKATELVYAVQLEQKFTKRQILALYLSRVYFGSGAWGIEAASRRFFDKPASRLTLREAGALAGVLKSPMGYSPVDQPERSAQRSALVLHAMVDTGAITDAERKRALAKPLKVYKRDPLLPSQYFVDWTDAQVRALYPKPKGDLVVDTTLDARMEASADSAARSALDDTGEQAALVAVDEVGRVRAMIGGLDYAASGFNRAILAKRQAGSAWKPFVYLTALEQGRTPDTLVVDEPVTFNGWSPRNHTDGYLGPITLQRALAESVNTVAARLAAEVGRDRVAQTARRLGITTPINTDPAMALGTSAVTPIDMATAYAAFSNGGLRASAYGVERIRTAAGAVIYQHRPAPRAQVIANPPLAELDGMLRTVLTQGTGKRALFPGYDLAGKTGTTSDSKDAWFCGFTGGLTTAVWVGRDDAKPVPSLAGGNTPAGVWKSFMVAALPRAGATPIRPGPAPPPPPVAPAPTQAADPVTDLLTAPAPPPPAPEAPRPEPRD